eukprot:TRINITY_DN5116_c5_g1_i1.p1 TRINITY_DN5116_c5_g1~~TRINITY_DN5116_c5_g1_i1.p1  ORF type:complete len:405 (+),score=46.83 TRINITY_DN5116_c5_g1_i1:25-1215(+)
MYRLQVDGYILRKELGNGASGTVYAAMTSQVGRSDPLPEERAVKVYKGDRAKQQFLLEQEFLSSVRGHPNVAELIAICEGTPNAIVMPLYRGLALKSLVRRRKGLPESVAAFVLQDILSATQYVHERGVLHRDIKPENILVSNEKAVLIDFDVACHMSQVDDPNLVRAGTAGYMSPEMILREPIGTPSDLFSIGCTLYFMFKRKPPFRTTPHSHDAVLDKTTRCNLQFDVCFDDVSNACKSLISSLVIRNPANRLTCGQVLQHEWLTSMALSDNSAATSGMSSTDDWRVNEQFPAPKLAGATKAPARPQSLPSASEAEQSEKSGLKDNSDMQQLSAPQSSSARRYVSQKPEPRRPLGTPAAPARLCFRKQSSDSTGFQMTRSPKVEGFASDELALH